MIIHLDGPDGNAFNILGVANAIGKQLGDETLLLLHGKKNEEIIKEMMSGNYENLLDTAKKYFGDYIEFR